MAAMLEYFRDYANAFETAVQNEESEEAYGGWTDIIMADLELLDTVRKMSYNQNNDEGRKLAVLHCKHPKESIRYLANKIMNGIPYEVVDRTKISL
jgi:hypothetical protein